MAKGLNPIQFNAVQSALKTLVKDAEKLELRLHDKTVGTVDHELQRLGESITYARNQLLD